MVFFYCILIIKNKKYSTVVILYTVYMKFYSNYLCICFQSILKQSKLRSISKSDTKLHEMNRLNCNGKSMYCTITSLDSLIADTTSHMQNLKFHGMGVSISYFSIFNYFNSIVIVMSLLPFASAVSSKSLYRLVKNTKILLVLV